MADGLSTHLEKTARFLDRLRRWVEPRHDLRALLVVGSAARGDAGAESDVDVVLLATQPGRYVENVDWVSELGVPESVAPEVYGNVTSVRAAYDNGLEVEYAIAAADWASEPFDAGTLEVARNGMVILLDRDGHAARLAAACLR